MRLTVPMWIILALFFGLSITYNVLTPYRSSGELRTVRNPETGLNQTALDIGAPDERQHANYIVFLQKAKSFPILNPQDPSLYENYQAHQPPLYYIVAAGWSTLFGDNLEIPEAGFRTRLLNTLIGLASIIGIYYLVIWGFGRSEAALAASAFFALLPMNIALHSAISNDPLLYCLAIWTTAFCAKVAQQGWSPKDAISIAGFAGLAILTKTTGLALIPVIITTLAITTLLHDKERRPNYKIPVTILAGPFFIAGPWLYRNLQLYGDPFALKVFTNSFTGSAQASMFIDSIGPAAYWMNFVLWYTARSFIGVFGYMDIFLMESLGSQKSGQIYLAAIFLVFLFIIIGIFSPIILKKDTEERSLPQPGRIHALLGVLAFVVIALFVRFNSTYFQGQARYLFPAMAAFASWFGLGLVSLTHSRSQGKNAWIIAIVILGLLNILSIMTINQGFTLRLNT